MMRVTGFIFGNNKEFKKAMQVSEKVCESVTGLAQKRAQVLNCKPVTDKDFHDIQMTAEILFNRASSIIRSKESTEASQTIAKFYNRAKAITILACGSTAVALTGLAIQYFTSSSE